MLIETNDQYREGIMNGALLLVESPLSPCDGSLLFCAVKGEFKIKRYHTSPKAHLINVDNGQSDPLSDEMIHTIHHARYLA